MFFSHYQVFLFHKCLQCYLSIAFFFFKLIRVPWLINCGLHEYLLDWTQVAQTKHVRYGLVGEFSWHVEYGTG